LISEGESIQIIDSDSEIELAKSFSIQSVPTFVLLSENKEIKRIIGAQTRDQLYRFIHE